MQGYGGDGRKGASGIILMGLRKSAGKSLKIERIGEFCGPDKKRGRIADRAVGHNKLNKKNNSNSKSHVHS